MVGHALLHKSVDPIESSQVSHGLTSFLSTGPCRSIESQQNADEHWLARQSHWQWRSQGLVLGTEGLWLQASERWKKMESSGVPVVFETYDTCWWTWFSLTFFLSSGPCRSIKGQQDGYNNRLVTQWNWQGRSQGLVLGTEGLWLQASERWKKMESSGVPVVFETCETLVLLDRCRGCACFQKSHWNWMETRWKWDGGGCSDTRKAGDKFYYRYQTISCFGGSSGWLRLVILASNIWWWAWLYVSVADRLVSSQVSHDLPSFLSTGPCRSIESQQQRYEHLLGRQCNWQGRSKGLVLGTVKWNQVVYQWCSRLVKL